VLVGLEGNLNQFAADGHDVGACEHADADLVQLFRRVVLNIAVGNRTQYCRVLWIA